MPGDCDRGADAVDVEQLRVEHVHDSAGYLGASTSEHHPSGRAEGDQRTPALRLGRVRLVVDQAVCLASAEDVADDIRDPLLTRWTPVGPTPAPLRGLVRRRDELLTGTCCALLQGLDDPFGDHLRERVAAAEIQTELVEQRDRVR